jgi:N-acetyl-gamma-glutamyl-phosphate reductase
MSQKNVSSGIVRVGVVGARGYTGEELIRLLVRHPYVRLTYLAATVEEPVPIEEVFPKFAGVVRLDCEKFDVARSAARCDLLFLALPHTASMDYVPQLAKKGLRIVDLSADYRLKDPKVYAAWYHKAHRDTGNLKRFVYGLPELQREKIAKASWVANPGCYPTAAVLAIAPVLAAGLAPREGIIIDAKSGVTGAGKKVAPAYLYPEVNENFKGYKFNAHQHSPEIEQELSRLADASVRVVFCPHLLPVNRGILETVYVPLTKAAAPEKILEVYKRFYKEEPFVRVRPLGVLPELKDVVGTNFCDIGIAADPVRKILVIVSVIDNLLKGASGQAVQNMNLMLGVDEKTSLL